MICSYTQRCAFAGGDQLIDGSIGQAIFITSELRMSKIGQYERSLVAGDTISFGSLKTLDMVGEVVRSGYQRH